MMRNGGGINGGLPQYTRQAQISATLNPNLPQGTPAAFGTAVAREQQKFGNAISDIGTKLADHYTKLQQLKDDNAVLVAENNLRAQVVALMDDPDKGLMQQKGHNADGITKQYDEKVDKLYDEAMQGMMSDNMRSQLMKRSSSWLNSYRARVAVAEGDEIRKYHLQCIDTNFSQSAQSAMQAPGATSWNTFILETAKNKADYMRVGGFDDKGADVELQKKRSPVFEEMARVLLANGQTQDLLDLYEAGKTQVTAASAAKVAQWSGELQKSMEAKKEFDSLLASDPANLTDNNGQTLNLPNVLKVIEKKHGENAKKIVKRLVRTGASSFSGKADIDKSISAAATEFGVDPALLAAIAEQESGFNQGSVSSAGARGVMQLMPDTAASLGVNADDANDNIRGGAKYIKKQLDRYGGDIDKALAAYNAGPGNVDQYGGIPPFKETQNYVKNVKALYDKHKKKSGKLDIASKTYYTVKAGKEQEVIDLDHDFWVKIQALSAKFEETFGNEEGYEPIHITAGASKSGHSSTGFHPKGLAVDVASDFLEKNPKALQWVIDHAGDYRLSTYNEYDKKNWTANTTAGHLHIDGRDTTPINENALKSGGHWETKEVSAYNPVMLKKLTDMARIEADRRSKQFQATTEKAAEALYQTYGIPSTYAQAEQWATQAGYTGKQRDAIAGMLYQRRKKQKADIEWEQRQKDRAREKAAESFYSWIVDNPGVSQAEKIAKAKEFGVHPVITARLVEAQSRAEGKDDAPNWFTGQTLSAFNAACSERKITGDRKIHAMEAVNVKAAEVWANEHRNLTPGEIEMELAKASAKKTLGGITIMGHTFGGTEIDSLGNLPENADHSIPGTEGY